jgi:hypothetical protein
MIVSGRYPIYLQVAGRLRGRVFNIPQDEWDALTPDQRWTFNKEFLDKVARVVDSPLCLVLESL